MSTKCSAPENRLRNIHKEHEEGFKNNKVYLDGEKFVYHQGFSEGNLHEKLATTLEEKHIMAARKSCDRFQAGSFPPSFPSYNKSQLTQNANLRLNPNGNQNMSSF